MKRILVLWTVAFVMAAMLVMSAGPVFAAGAQKTSSCREDVTLPTTGVTGTLCERTVFTPSGNQNQQQHFKPEDKPEDPVLEGGAQQESIKEPSEQSSHIVFTPSGNSTAHNNFH
jgi:hypothetical protein